MLIKYNNKKTLINDTVVYFLFRTLQQLLKAANRFNGNLKFGEKKEKFLKKDLTYNIFSFFFLKKINQGP